MRRPVKSVQTILEQQIRAVQSSEKDPRSEVFDRLVAALGIDMQVLRHLLESHPHPIIEEMTQAEIEEWALAGMLPVIQSSKSALLGHSIRLLGRLSAESEEIKTLSQDMAFLTMLERLRPGAGVLELCAGDRAFVLYVLHTIGLDAPQDLLDEAICDYRRIVPQLESAIEFDAIAELLKDPDADWAEFFESVVSDRLDSNPSKEEILRKMQRIAREPSGYIEAN
jgi:hypothetical protein